MKYHYFLIRSLKIFLLSLILFPLKAGEERVGYFCLAPKSQMFKVYELESETQTSFFRDYSSLFMLFEETLDRVLESKNERLKQSSEKEPLLIHSAGASNFKEAYSVIMSLYDHYEQYPEKWGEYTPEDVFVQASDISGAAVASGIQGAYSAIDIMIFQNSLMKDRGWDEKKSENYIHKYFNKTGQGSSRFYTIKPEYKKNLIPRVGNLMNPDIRPPKADIILYNNVWRPVYYEYLNIEFMGSLAQFLHSLQRNHGGFIISNALTSFLPHQLRSMKSLDDYYILGYEDTPSGNMDQGCSMTKYIGEFV